MWEKLKIRERDRIMGFVFLAGLFVVFGFTLIASRLPQAALGTGIFFLLILSVMLARIFRVWLQCRSARAPVGPLSVDEKLKARSKLIKPRAQPQTRLD